MSPIRVLFPIKSHMNGMADCAYFVKQIFETPLVNPGDLNELRRRGDNDG